MVSSILLAAGKSGHMNYKMVRQFMTELRARDLATHSTRCYITHMVPVKYSQCAPVARGMDLLMAHDGLRIFKKHEDR